MEIISDFTGLFVSVFCQSSNENETHEKITYPDTPVFLSKNVRLLDKSRNVYTEQSTMEMIDGFKTLIAFLETYTEQDVIGFEPVPVEYEVDEDEMDEETEILLEMFEALLEEDELEEMEEWVDDFLHEKWMEQEDREIAEIEEETRLLDEDIRLLDEDIRLLDEEEEEEVVSNHTKLSLILPEETEGWVEETYPPSKTEEEETEKARYLEEIEDLEDEIAELENELEDVDEEERKEKEENLEYVKYRLKETKILLEMFGVEEEEEEDEIEEVVVEEDEIEEVVVEEDEIEEVVSNQICFPEDVWKEVKSYLFIDIDATPLMAYIRNRGLSHYHFNIALDYSFGGNLNEFFCFAYHSMSYQQKYNLFENDQRYYWLEKTMPELIKEEGYKVGKLKDTPAKTWKQTLEKYSINPPEYRIVNGETYVILSGEKLRFDEFFVYFYSQNKRVRKGFIPSTFQRNIKWEVEPRELIELGLGRLETVEEVRAKVKEYVEGNSDRHYLFHGVQLSTIPRNAL